MWKCFQAKSGHPVRVAAATLIILCLHGCATKTVATGISPDDAQTLLASGDEISVISKDRTYLVMQVEKVDELAITGEDNQIMLTDIESITLLEEKRTAAPLWETLEAASYLLILWPFFVF